MIDEDRLLDFFLQPGREKRLEVLDGVISKLAAAGERVPILELLELVPWYAEHHSTPEAVGLVSEVFLR